MARILVIGGGIVGLSTAMLLTRQGNDVTVLERDAEPAPSGPDDAWRAWERRGVAQFRQAHYLHAQGASIVERHLPELAQALRDAGCVTFDLLSAMPPSITDRASREGDERFVTLTGRRPVLEYAAAVTAAAAVDIRRGTSVAAFVTGPPAASGTPHITGVRTETGEQLSADLIIDATGRRSKLPDWLEAVGGRRPVEERTDVGFMYYTRFFRSASGEIPPCRSGLLTDFETFSLLTLPSDNGTWSVTIYTFAGDPAMKTLRAPDPWRSLVAACPLQAHWLDGQPITDVLPYGGVVDRYRRFVVNGTPVATGILAVSDAWACTNPALGRGITLGLMHAVGTAEVVQRHLDDPMALALAHDDMTESRVTPWYRDQLEMNRARIAGIRDLLDGRPPAVPAGPDQGLLVGMLYDADLFRAFVDMISLNALPQEVMARPGMTQRIAEIAGAHAPAPPPGPTHDQVRRLLA